MIHPKLVLDMDGILADFVGGMCKTFGRPNPYDEGFTDWNIETAPVFSDLSRNQMFKVTKDADWWANLDKTPEADLIMKTVQCHFPINNICICTSPTRPVMPSIDGKQRWLKKHYRGFEHRVIPTNLKFFLASPFSLLVDDADKNVDAFHVHGGHTLLVPRPWNTRRDDQGTFDFAAELNEAFERIVMGDTTRLHPHVEVYDDEP